MSAQILAISTLLSTFSFYNKHILFYIIDLKGHWILNSQWICDLVLLRPHHCSVCFIGWSSFVTAILFFIIGHFILFAGMNNKCGVFFLICTHNYSFHLNYWPGQEQQTADGKLCLITSTGLGKLTNFFNYFHTVIWSHDFLIQL